MLKRLNRVLGNKKGKRGLIGQHRCPFAHQGGDPITMGSTTLRADFPGPIGHIHLLGTSKNEPAIKDHLIQQLNDRPLQASVQSLAYYKGARKRFALRGRKLWSLKLNETKDYSPLLIPAITCGARGSRTSMRVPLPKELSTWIVPPCASMIDWAIGRPRPVPLRRPSLARA